MPNFRESNRRKTQIVGLFAAQIAGWRLSTEMVRLFQKLPMSDDQTTQEQTNSVEQASISPIADPTTPQVPPPVDESNSTIEPQSQTQEPAAPTVEPSEPKEEALATPPIEQAPAPEQGRAQDVAPLQTEPNVIIKEVIREVPVETIVERIVEKPVEVVKEIVKEVPVDRVVERIVEKPVEKIIEKEVVREVPVFDHRQHAEEVKKKARMLVVPATAQRQAKRDVKLAKVLEEAKRKGRIGNNDVQILVAVSDRTARNYLAELVKQGKLKTVHRGRWAHYVPV